METYEVTLDGDTDLAIISEWTQRRSARVENIARNIVNVSITGELEDELVALCERKGIECRLL